MQGDRSPTDDARCDWCGGIIRQCEYQRSNPGTIRPSPEARICAQRQAGQRDMPRHRRLENRSNRFSHATFASAPKTYLAGSELLVPVGTSRFIRNRQVSFLVQACLIVLEGISSASRWEERSMSCTKGMQRFYRVPSRLETMSQSASQAMILFKDCPKIILYDPTQRESMDSEGSWENATGPTERTLHD